MWLAPELSTNGVHEATGLCVLTASLRKPNGRWHSRRTAAGLAAGRVYQREPSCSSPPWQSVHEPRSARHVVTEIAALCGSDVEPQSTLWRRLWRESSWTCQGQRPQSPLKYMHKTMSTKMYIVFKKTAPPLYFQITPKDLVQYQCGINRRYIVRVVVAEKA